MSGQRGSQVKAVAYERRPGGEWRVIHSNYDELRSARVAAQYAESKGWEAVAAQWCPWPRQDGAQ